MYIDSVKPCYSAKSTLPLMRYSVSILVATGLLYAGFTALVDGTRPNLVLGAFWAIFMFAFCYRANVVRRYEILDDAIRFTGPLGTHRLNFEEIQGFRLEEGRTIRDDLAWWCGAPRRKIGLEVSFWRWGIVPNYIFVAEPWVFLAHLDQAYQEWRTSEDRSKTGAVFPQRPSSPSPPSA